MNGISGGAHRKSGGRPIGEEGREGHVALFSTAMSLADRSSGRVGQSSSALERGSTSAVSSRHLRRECCGAIGDTTVHKKREANREAASAGATVAADTVSQGQPKSAVLLESPLKSARQLNASGKRPRSASRLRMKRINDPAGVVPIGLKG